MILKYAIVSLTVLLCACQSQNSEDASSRSLAGGWNETEITDEVKEATNFVIDRMNTASKLKSIDEASVQIVNGTNYDITFTLEDGESWKTRVHRSLKGEMSIMEPAVKL